MRIKLLCAVVFAIALTFTGIIEARAQEIKEEIKEETKIKVSEETYIPFTPDVTGYWTFETSGNGSSDPLLRILNLYGIVLGSDDDSAGGLNAYLTLHLVGGAEYMIHAGFWDGGAGAYTLTITHSDVFTGPRRVTLDMIPSEGGTTSGGHNGAVLFAPKETGLWHVALAGNGDEAEIWIQDSVFNTIAYHYVDVGLMPPEITVHLVAGQLYSIEFWSWSEDLYAEDVVSTLTIAPRTEFEPWMDVDAYGLTGRIVGFENVSAGIPPAGGTVNIQGETWLSFTPDTTGRWIFETSDRIGDPMLFVTDAYGSFLTHDDDSAGNLNAYLELSLAEGVEYRIGALFWDEEGESYTLTVTLGAAYEGKVSVHSLTMPENGGYILLESGSVATVSFTPAFSGYWSIELDGHSGAVFFDANRSLEIWIESWRWGAVATVYLSADETYGLLTFSLGSDDAYLHISPSTEIRPAQGVTYMLRQVRAETRFTFVPPVPGLWIIETEDNDGDPYLSILNMAGDVLASDDDSAHGLNAFIEIWLEAGEIYYIDAGFYADSGLYVLALTPPEEGFQTL